MNSTRRRNVLSKLMLTLALISFPSPARAQVVVIDPPNLVQNTGTFLKTTAMLAIMVENFIKGKGDMEALLPLLKRLEETIKQGDALGYGTGNLAEVFDEKFPGYEIYGGPWSEQSQMSVRTELDTLRNILQAAQMQNQNYEQDQQFLAGVLAKSNAAVGEMQALQQGNALVAASVTQLAKLRQLLLAQINATAVSQAAETNRRAQSEAQGVAWSTANPLPPPPMSANDARGIGDLQFLAPKR